MSATDSEIDILAREMTRDYPKDAADKAMLRSNAFRVLGYAEKSEKWERVAEAIKKMSASVSPRLSSLVDCFTVSGCPRL